jgi:transcriptional regulator with XRE-family HTH domain
MAGTSYTHIWKVENGKVNVGLDLLGRISNALGIPLRDLFVPHTTWDVEVTRHDLRDQPHDQAGNSHSS